MCPPREEPRLVSGSDAASGGTQISGKVAPLTVTVAGGKGGVGKTSVALNLALVFARQGYRTLLLDGDLELANINVMLGLYPKATLEHAISGKLNVEQVLVSVSENLDLLPGASGVESCLGHSVTAQRRFLRQLAALESRYDRVVIDTAAGLGNNALHMIAAAHLTLLIVTPDPTSLTDAFSLLKVLRRRGYRRQPNIVINMARGLGQARSIYQRFSVAVSRYLGIDCHYLGAIWRDESIAQSVVSQKPVASLPESDPSSRQFWTLSEMLAVRWAQGTPRSLGFSRYWIRLLERKRADTVSGDQQPHPGQIPETPLPDSPTNQAVGQKMGAETDPGWPAHFRAWLQGEEIDALERYHVVNEWLSVLGEALDEDMVETLQTGLSNMRWNELPAPLRQSAAAHFRQLADLIAPAPTAVDKADPHRYAADVFGPQDALLTQLRQQPSGHSLSQILEQLRQTETRFRSAGGRRNSQGER